MSELQHPRLDKPNEIYIDLACLDIDGHIADTHFSLVDGHCQLYRIIHGQAPSDDFEALANNLVGGRASDVFVGLYPEMRLQENPQRLRRMIDEFRTIVNDNPTPALRIEGVPEELERLYEAGLDIAGNTNRGEDTLPRVLESSDINPDWFIAIFTPERSPDKTSAIRSLMSQRAISAAHVSMSGDTVGDIYAGVAAGVQTFGVPRPGLSPEQHEEHRRQLEQAGAYVFDSFVELGQTALRPIIN